jgi:hypothetical protein
MALHIHIHHNDADLEDELEQLDNKIQDMEDKGLTVPTWMRNKRDELSVRVNKLVNAKEKFAAMKAIMDPPK